MYSTATAAKRLGITPRGVLFLAHRLKIGQWVATTGTKRYLMLSSQDIAELRRVVQPQRGRPRKHKERQE